MMCDEKNIIYINKEPARLQALFEICRRTQGGL